jgi:hypothetical protein
MRTPIPREAILDGLETLFHLIRDEPHAEVSGLYWATISSCSFVHISMATDVLAES